MQSPRLQLGATFHSFESLTHQVQVPKWAGQQLNAGGR